MSQFEFELPTSLRMKKALGIVAALIFPFLAVLAFGLLFDTKTGGDPHYATVATLFFLSPLWLVFGIVLSVTGFRNDKLRFRLMVADGVLLVVIAAALAVVRTMNGL